MYLNGRQLARETPVSSSVEEGSYRLKVCFEGDASRCVTRRVRIEANRETLEDFEVNGLLRAFSLVVLVIATLGCGPAEPVGLSAVKVEIGESGTLFYNRAQVMVRQGDAIDLSLQLPLDIHFHNGSQWWSTRVETGGGSALG